MSIYFYLLAPFPHLTDFLDQRSFPGPIKLIQFRIQEMTLRSDSSKCVAELANN